MPMELRPLRRRLRLHKAGLGYAGRIGERPVVAVVSGMGTSLAHAATVRLLDAVDVEWVIVNRVQQTVRRGMRQGRAHPATVRLLDAVDVEWVIVVGIAGAIENQTPIGTLVLPEFVISGADGSEHRPT